jgi:capsule polysaccharide export protein KpsE/RkpR
MPKAKGSKTTRKPSVTVIKKTERTMLAQQSKVDSLKKQKKKAEADLSALKQSNVRLKLTKTAQLKKLIAELDKKIASETNRLKGVEVRMEGYSSIIW